jgi:hypothetical protein
MHTQAHAISLHRKRARTRSTALVLALTAFAAVKLVSLGAVNADQARIEGFEMMDVDCAAETNSVTC